MASVGTRRNILVLAALLGLVTGFLVLKFLQGVEARDEATVPVVVASYDILPRTTIDESMVRVLRVRQSVAPRHSFGEMADVVGKVALTSIPANTAIGHTEVAARGSALGLAFAIEPGMRAVTVAVDAVIGVAGFLKPGDRVDVIATIGRGDDAMVLTVLQDVQLLAFGSQLEKERLQAEGQDKPTQLATRGRDTATLLVTPQDAERLVLAENEGKLRLILRSVDDMGLSETDATSRSDLTGKRPSPTPVAPAASRPAARTPAPRPAVRAVEPAATRPAPAPVAAPVMKKVEEPKHQIEVIRGTKVETVEVNGTQ